ncbi:hypothetical protein EC849_11691 [Pseudomonas putida]|nr:hypothetical protein EC849_11691 [Pseudomonas putida]
MANISNHRPQESPNRSLILSRNGSIVLQDGEFFLSKASCSRSLPGQDIGCVNAICLERSQVLEVHRPYGCTQFVVLLGTSTDANQRRKFKLSKALSVTLFPEPLAHPFRN